MKLLAWEDPLPRQEAPLRSNLLEHDVPCPGRSVGPEFFAPSMQKRRRHLMGSTRGCRPYQFELGKRTNSCDVEKQLISRFWSLRIGHIYFFHCELLFFFSRLDPWKWRANHYVSLLGRAVVFRVEEATPELRDFSIYDGQAVALGHRLG